MGNEAIIWAVIPCPIYGDFRRQILENILAKPDPWVTQARRCICSERITGAKTMVLVRLDSGFRIDASVWISFPDCVALMPFEGFPYLFHVHVLPGRRSRGIGKQLIRRACEYLERRGFGRILLSSGHPELRDRFYNALGFVPVGDDPYLMVYSPERPVTKVSTEFQHLGLPAGRLRSISDHDLATVQSICGVRHWGCSSGGCKIESPEECEEEFCRVCHRGTDQFLIAGFFSMRRFVSWYREEGESWTQKIVADDMDFGEIKELSAQNAREIKALASKYLSRTRSCAL